MRRNIHENACLPDKTRSPPISAARQNATPLKLQRNLQTFFMSLVVIRHQTGAELFDYLLIGPVLCTLMQYPITFRSWMEPAIVVVSGILFIRHKAEIWCFSVKPFLRNSTQRLWRWHCRRLFFAITYDRKLLWRHIWCGGWSECPSNIFCESRSSHTWDMRLNSLCDGRW